MLSIFKETQMTQETKQQFAAIVGRVHTGRTYHALLQAERLAIEQKKDVIVVSPDAVIPIFIKSNLMKDSVNYNVVDIKGIDQEHLDRDKHVIAILGDEYGSDILAMAEICSLQRVIVAKKIDGVISLPSLLGNYSDNILTIGDVSKDLMNNTPLGTKVYMTELKGHASDFHSRCGLNYLGERFPFNI